MGRFGVGALLSETDVPGTRSANPLSELLLPMGNFGCGRISWGLNQEEIWESEVDAETLSCRVPMRASVERIQTLLPYECLSPFGSVTMNTAFGGNTVQFLCTTNLNERAVVVPVGSATIEIAERSLPRGFEQTVGTNPTTVEVTDGGTATDLDGYYFPTAASTKAILPLPPALLRQV